MTVTAEVYGNVVTTTLRAKFGPLRFASELLARLVGVAPATAQNWLEGKHAPRGAELIRLMARCDELSVAIQRLVEAERNCSRR